MFQTTNQRKNSTMLFNFGRRIFHWKIPILNIFETKKNGDQPGHRLPTSSCSFFMFASDLPLGPKNNNTSHIWLARPDSLISRSLIPTQTTESCNSIVRTIDSSCQMTCLFHSALLVLKVKIPCHLQLKNAQTLSQTRGKQSCFSKVVP